MVNCTYINIDILNGVCLDSQFFNSMGEAKNSAHCGVQFSPMMQMEGTGTAALKPSHVRSALVT